MTTEDLVKPQEFGKEEEEEVTFRIEKVIKKVRNNRKFCPRSVLLILLLGVQSACKIGVGFTIDTDSFDNFFDSEGNLFF